MGSKVPKPDRSDSTEAGGSTPIPPLELETVRGLWPEVVKKVGAKLGMRLVAAEPIGLEGSDVLVIAAKPGYNSFADVCASSEAREKVEEVLERLLRRPLTVRYQQSLATAGI